MNQLQALAMNEGQRRKKKLWSEQGRTELVKLSLGTWASRRDIRQLPWMEITRLHFDGGPALDRSLASSGILPSDPL